MEAAKKTTLPTKSPIVKVIKVTKGPKMTKTGKVRSYYKPITGGIWVVPEDKVVDAVIVCENGSVKVRYHKLEEK